MVKIGGMLFFQLFMMEILKKSIISFMDILSIIRSAILIHRIIEYFKEKYENINNRINTNNEIFSFISRHLNESDLINELDYLWNKSKFQWIL